MAVTMLLADNERIAYGTLALWALLKSSSYRGGDLLTQRGWQTTDNEQGSLDSNPGPQICMLNSCTTLREAVLGTSPHLLPFTKSSSWMGRGRGGSGYDESSLASHARECGLQSVGQKPGLLR